MLASVNVLGSAPVSAPEPPEEGCEKPGESRQSTVGPTWVGACRVNASNGVERPAFATLVACHIAPIVAHGLWRPAEHVFGSAGTAGPVTAAALAIGASGAAVRRFGPMPALVAGVLAAVAASAGLSLGVAGLAALLTVAGASAWLHTRLPALLPPAFDGLARANRLLTALYVLVALGSVVSTARVSVFIGDPTAVEDQALPGEKFTETHSCLSAYVRASELARQGFDNLYADHWWYGSRGLPPLPMGVSNPFRPFELDNFSYPPPFLVVALPLALLDGDFLAQRALWFGLNGVVAALGLWVVARWIDGPGAHRALVLAPLLFGSVPVLLTLQIGNFHLAATMLTLLALVAFDGRRAATGGALLALTTLSKISPGILGVALLVRGRARDVAFTAGFGALLLTLTVLLFGVGPIASFVTFALPRLSSGAAFPFMDTEAGIATNLSPFGLGFKLKALGVHVGDPWHVGPVIARVYTVGVVALAVASARRAGDRRDQAIRWMALLVLAAMQSPFSPAYATIGLLWATTLLAVEVRRPWQAVVLIALWPAILLVPPGLPVAGQAVLSMAQTALTIGVSVWLVVRAPRDWSNT